MGDLCAALLHAAVNDGAGTGGGALAHICCRAASEMLLWAEQPPAGTCPGLQTLSACLHIFGGGSKLPLGTLSGQFFGHFWCRIRLGKAVAE